MAGQSPEIELTGTERQTYREWLESASQSAQKFNGSEKTKEQLLEPLLAMDAFVKSKNNGQSSAELERSFADAVWPDRPPTLHTINDFLQAGTDAYLRKLKDTSSYADVLSLIEQGGGVVKHSARTFVQTDEGRIEAASSPVPQPLEHKTQPRLAKAIQHLKEEGIYTDDIVAHVGMPDKRMVRQLPYILLQIPRLDKEIAVCDEVGEVTFVSNKILGTDVWANLSKEQLKTRPEITAVKFTNEEGWWNGIRQVLLEVRSPSQKQKVDVAAFSRHKQPLDRELIKQSILAHRLETGEWPKTTSREVLHGPYKGQTQWGSLESSLRSGNRGLPSGSSLAALNEEVSKEHGLGYVNRMKQEGLDITKIKESILAHRRGTGVWPTRGSGEVRYGPYKGQTQWKTLDSNLVAGARGLPGGSSLAALNEEVSKEHGLDYVNHLKTEDLDIAKIKKSILAHRLATNTWPTHHSGDILHGPYKEQTRWAILDSNLGIGGRGLPGGSSLPALNEEVSKEHGLDYVNRFKKEDLNIAKIKESILAHRKEMGAWPTDRSGEILHGPYKGQMQWNTLSTDLKKGDRGLPGGSSLADLNEEVSREHGLDYVNRFKQEKLDIGKIKESILAHRKEMGAWPSSLSGEVRYGPYKGQRWGSLNVQLTRAGRGLPGGSSISALNEEVSREHGLDYVKGRHSAWALSSRRSTRQAGGDSAER